MKSKPHAGAASPPAIGIDIGGVIIRPARESGDTSFFSSGYLETPMVEGAFEAVAQLNRELFPGAVHLVSKAKSGTARKTLDWLSHHAFHHITGVPLERVHFCEERAEKAVIARRLNLTAFVDDRIDVLEHLRAVPTRILFAATTDFIPRAAPPKGVALAVGWTQAMALLGVPA